MEEQISESATNQLVIRLEQHVSEQQGVSYRDYDQILVNHAVEESERLQKIYDLICWQLGFWESQWMFSPANAPDTEAAAEYEGWRGYWFECYETLLARDPEQQAQLLGKQRLNSLNQTRKRRAEFNSRSVSDRIGTILLSQAAYVVNKVGMNDSAVKMYARCLYPSGTVGRTSACG